MRVNTNVVGISSRSKLEKNITDLDRQNRSLATGDRIYRAAIDPAGLSISEGMRARIRSSSQAQRNATDSISLIQVAEGSLSSVQSMASRMKELALQSANDTLGNEERGLVDSEFQQMKREIKRIILASEFNGQKILDRNAGIYEFQVGINSDGAGDRVSYDMGSVLSSAEKVSLGSASVRTKAGSQASLSEIDRMLTEVSGARAFLGATQTRMQSTIQNLSVSRENTAVSNSRIRDTDVAKATAERAISSIKTSASTNVVAQTNKLPEEVKRLL
ncbi:MAG: flagellin FliC [Bacteriovoracaceae bacterium]|nr:flagellin FliC [Bacteriovoracaceae bacterium]